MKFAFAGASVLLLCLAGLLSRGGQTSIVTTAEVLGPVLPSPDSAPAKSPRPYLAQADAPNSKQRRRVTAADAETTATPLAATGDDRKGLLTGRILVKEDDGRETAGLSGVIRACLLRGDEVRYEEIAVESGAFELLLDTDEIATFQHNDRICELTLGGRAARLEHPEKKYSSVKNPVLLMAEIWSRVVDEI